VGALDAIVIGSGFGASMAAKKLVDAGRRVLMVERGDWVPRGEQARMPAGSLELTPHYSKESQIRVLAGGLGDYMGTTSCVGGPSVFYGGVSIRFREKDFEHDDQFGAVWPFSYDALEPHYCDAERILDVSGDDSDPHLPRRSIAYPQDTSPLAPAAAKIRDAAEALGLKPFRLPLAINYRSDGVRTACAQCRTCDTFACFAGAKNDLATAVIPSLVERGMQLAHNTVVTKLVVDGERIARIECFDKTAEKAISFEAERFILAAGALHTPHLLLASGLEKMNPAGASIGANLIRHSSAIVYGIFMRRVDPAQSFHKQIGIHDFYFGDPEAKEPEGKLGSLQSMHPPPRGLVLKNLPPVIGTVLAPGAELMGGLLAMAEDQPRAENRVTIDGEVLDKFGLPQLRVEHQHTERDLQATKVLAKRAQQILRKAGAVAFYVHPIKTFSHALGTVRMGSDEATCPLDAAGRFRGLQNLWITDGSALPRSAGVNPSLTIAANALRVGSAIP
jgi:choline dehydrogenase-like flavoprotein